MVHLYTPENVRKAKVHHELIVATKYFLTLSGGIEMEQWTKMS